MTETLPTIVLVHGAWHTPAIYQGYISALEAAGFTVHCPRLPSCCSASPPPPAPFASDVACVRALLHSLLLANPNERILVTMHSYGGAVGTDAVSSLDLDPHPAKVIHLLYLCAYLLPPSSAIWDIVEAAGFAPQWPRHILDDDDDDDGLCFPRDPLAVLFNGVLEAAARSAGALLVRWPGEALRARTRGDAWRRIPATYVRTARDRAVPPAYQDIMLRRVADEGVAVRVEEYDTGHSIFITMQDEMVRAALRAARDERNAA
ncbi:alpha/beta-hydrolase [Xylariaceae sp. FL0662B]|nr:alpha/beta-hydrolase [Xylariaceae sp. FL0662B]